MDFRSGCWLIGGRPKNLLILGDHLFLNYIFLGGKFLLINRGCIINPHLALAATHIFHVFIRHIFVGGWLTAVVNDSPPDRL